MDIHSLEWPGVALAALSCFAVGFVWYSPALFGNAWMRANGFTKEQVNRGNPAVIFGGALVLSLIIATNLAIFLGPDAGVRWGATAGGLAGGGWVAASFGVIYLFEHRPFQLFAINGGYHLVTFVVMGAIIGAW